MNGPDLARILGILAALLLLLYAVAAFFGAIVVGILGREGAAGLALGSILALVYAALTGILSVYAHRSRDHALPGGVVLLGLALAEWIIVPTGGFLLGGIALVLTLLAGLLFLLDGLGADRGRRS